MCLLLKYRLTRSKTPYPLHCYCGVSIFEMSYILTKQSVAWRCCLSCLFPESWSDLKITDTRKGRTRRPDRIARPGIPIPGRTAKNFQAYLPWPSVDCAQPRKFFYQTGNPHFPKPNHLPTFVHKWNGKGNPANQPEHGTQTLNTK